MRRALAMALVLAAAGGAALAQQVTVQSLLAQSFTVVAATQTSVGAGLFLQKEDKLFFCLVTETPRSATVATRYCKPVE